MNDALIDFIVQRWCEAVTYAYELARGQRLADLRGERVKTFDSRFMHPFSEAIGAAHQCQQLVGTLAYCELDPRELWKQAQRDANELYRQEVLAGA